MSFSMDQLDAFVLEVYHKKTLLFLGYLDVMILKQTTIMTHFIKMNSNTHR